MASEKPKTLEDVVREAKRQYGALAYCSVDEDTYCAQEAAEWGREQERRALVQSSYAGNLGKRDFALVRGGARQGQLEALRWVLDAAHKQPGFKRVTVGLEDRIEARIKELTDAE